VWGGVGLRVSQGVCGGWGGGKCAACALGAAEVSVVGLCRKRCVWCS
jgi:hypothetical protein